jgi:hypothetical protein
MMSKSWNGGKPQKIDKEISKVQKINHENKRLRDEISRIRKAMSRMDSGWCPGCLKKYEKEGEDTELPHPGLADPVENNRPCFKCGAGNLVLVKYYKINEAFYFRKCDKCPHRTRGKRFTPDVKD